MDGVGYGIIHGMKPINTSIFDFPTLLAKGYVCVDRMVNGKGKGVGSE